MQARGGGAEVEVGVLGVVGIVEVEGSDDDDADGKGDKLGVSVRDVILYSTVFTDPRVLQDSDLRPKGEVGDGMTE
jgi:hypothetical protein